MRARTLDVDADGLLDHYELTFASPVRDASFPGFRDSNTVGLATSHWLVEGRCDGAVTFCAVDPVIPWDVDDDAVVFLAFPEGRNLDTAALPNVSTNSTPGLRDHQGLEVRPIEASFAEQDGARPVLVLGAGKTYETSLTLHFSEPVLGNGSEALSVAAFQFIHTGPEGASGFAGILDSDGSDGQVQLRTAGILLLGNNLVDRVAVVPGEVFDASGNDACNLVQADGALLLVEPSPLRLQSATTLDLDADGRIDHYMLRFTKPVEDSTFPGYLAAESVGDPASDWFVAGRASVRLDLSVEQDAPNDPVLFLAFPEDDRPCGTDGESGCDTGMVPDLTTSATPGLRDLEGQALTAVDTTGVNESDGAGPLLVSAVSVPGSTTLKVRFSEAIPAGISASSASAYAYRDLNGLGARVVAAVLDPDGSDREVALTLDQPFVSADEAESISIPAFVSFPDASGNDVSSVAVSVRLAPVLLEAATLDLDGDGQLDHYRLTFSSKVTDASFPGFRLAKELGNSTWDWRVEGGERVAFDGRVAEDVADDEVVYLSFRMAALGRCFPGYPEYCTTGALPELTTTDKPMLLGRNGVEVAPVAAEAAVEVDRAPPVLTRARGDAAELAVSFSEPVSGAATAQEPVQLSDFVYANLSGGGVGSLATLDRVEEGGRALVFTTGTPFALADHGLDTVAPRPQAIFDAAGNAAAVAARSVSTHRVLGLYAGGRHLCARIEGGVLRCWGEGDGYRLGYSNTEHVYVPNLAGNVPLQGTVTALAGSRDSTTTYGTTCALLSDGSLRCWGTARFGGLGTSGTAFWNASYPATPNLGGTVASHAGGGRHYCAVMTGGAVRCWGWGAYGQLGLGTISFGATTCYPQNNCLGDDSGEMPPPLVDLGAQAAALTAGYGHTCALTATGAVRCWGNNDHGQLGYGHTNWIGDDEAPAVAGDVPVLTAEEKQAGRKVVQMAAGDAHTCALLDTGAVRCWGQGDGGRLGYGNASNIGDDETPASAGDIDLGATVVKIAAGIRHTCVLTTTGKVRCWGKNLLGYGTTSFGSNANLGDEAGEMPAADVAVGSRVTDLVAAADVTCALLENGHVRCWGGKEWYGLPMGEYRTFTDPVGDDELPVDVGEALILD